MNKLKGFVQSVKQVLGKRKLIVAIQREPYMHIKIRDGVEVKSSAGGAHSLLDGILRRTGGLMVAIAAGDADYQTVDDKGRVKVPPGEESYTLKRLFLKKKELEGFYYGFANQTLWPLCHAVFVKPQFNPKWWEDYVSVNQRFAAAILEEVGDEDCVWINDYHLGLLPQLLKAVRPKLKVGVFWHIPWPTHEIFRICPWRKEILEGLLGADFIGFHRGYHVDNFIECIRRELEARVQSEPRSVQYKDHETRLSHLPAGIDYVEIENTLSGVDFSRDLIQKDFGIETEYLAIGVDRIDYTKGIPERLKIIDRFLEKYPQYQGKFTYLSIGAPSRVHIPAYKALNNEINDLVEKINWKYSTESWQPINYVNKIVPREKILAYYRYADICLVTSLDDGMNLVAKEFIICNEPDKGMLLLSKFTGAAKDLTEAILINPYHTDRAADKLAQALAMSTEEKKRRNLNMKRILEANDIYEWGMKFISETVGN